MAEKQENYITETTMKIERYIITSIEGLDGKCPLAFLLDIGEHQKISPSCCCRKYWFYGMKDSPEILIDKRLDEIGRMRLDIVDTTCRWTGEFIKRWAFRKLEKNDHKWPERMLYVSQEAKIFKFILIQSPDTGGSREEIFSGQIDDVVADDQNLKLEETKTKRDQGFRRIPLRLRKQFPDRYSEEWIKV